VTQPGDAPGPRRPRPPSPEFIGGAIAVGVILIIATTALAAGAPPAVPPTPGGGSAEPSHAIQSAVPTPTPLVNPALVELLRKLNESLSTSADALEAERARVNLRTDEVQGIIRQVRLRVAAGIEATGSLGPALKEGEPGAQLADLYAQIDASAATTLEASLNNADAYRRGAGTLIGLIRQLPAIQAELDKLALPPTPAPSTPPPSPTASAPASRTPSATTVPTPPSSPSASTSGAPTASLPGPVGDEQIENGGFEAGVGRPWALFLAPGAGATLSADAGTPGAGKTSARVDITNASLASSGISVRQSGLSLEAGRLYALSLAVRAASDREIRARVTSASGGQYYGQVIAATTVWTTQTFVFTAGVGDADAVLELDFGQGDATTWIDGVSFRPLGT
jgi:hypothetical protein